MLVAIIFTFSHNVFRGPFPQGCEICHYEVKDIEDIWVFLVKDWNVFHRVDTIGNIFSSGKATSENITDGVHEVK